MKAYSLNYHKTLLFFFVAYLAISTTCYVSENDLEKKDYFNTHKSKNLDLLYIPVDDGITYNLTLANTSLISLDGKKAENSLQEKSELKAEVDTLFQTSSILALVFQMNPLKATKVSKGFIELLGWTEQEFLTKPLDYFIYEGDSDRTARTAAAISEGKSLLGFENRYRQRNGSLVWLQWTTLTENTSLNKGEVLVMARDITQEKKKLANLHQEIIEKNEVLLALNDINNAYFLNSDSLDFNLNSNNISKNYKAILQMIAESFIKLSYSQYGLLSEVLYDDLQQPFTKSSPDHLVFSNSRGSNQLMMQSTEDINKCFDLCHEVTQSVLKLKDLYIGRYTIYATKRTLSDDEKLVHQDFTILGLPIFAFQENHRILNSIIVLHLSSDKHLASMVDRLKPLMDKTGRVFSERKIEKMKGAMELELHAAKEREIKQQIDARLKSDAANEAKSTFVSHMSHEIRTPLNGIMGFLELALREESLPVHIIEYLNNAYSSTKSLQAVANDILDLSRIEKDAFRLEILDFNPLSIAQEVCSSFTLESEKKAINFKLKIAPRVPQTLRGDPLRYKQILFNLVGNAMKFTEKGIISVRIDGIAENKHTQDYSLVGSIKDSGIGMTTEQIDKLFRPFAQADDSILRKFGGTGLGLYITKQLCEKMGGSIKVSSQTGLGSTFEFKINLQQCDLNNQTVSTKVETRNDQLPSGLRVLVVEDNLMNQKLIKVLLSKENCRVTIADNGQLAIKALMQESYDIILMDGEMPVMDGLEATRHIRNILSNNIPILGLTGHAMTTHKELFLSSGMNGYLTKPINKQELFNEILRCINNK